MGIERAYKIGAKEEMREFSRPILKTVKLKTLSIRREELEALSPLDMP